MKNALLLCPLLALAACASSDSMVKTSKKAQPDPHKLARTSDCITESLVTGFQGLDTRHLLLYGSGGRKVFLFSSTPDVTVPAEVIVPAGLQSRSFTVSSSPVSVTTLVSVVAKAGSVQRTVVVTLNP